MPEDKQSDEAKQEGTAPNVVPYLSDSSKFTIYSWKDTMLDFGTVTKGKMVEIKFICTNTGTKDLVLANVKPSCGCTLADYTKQPIAPGKTGFITAKFDSNKSHGGQVRKTISYEVNSDYKPRLAFAGTVNDPNATKDSSIN